MGKRSAVKQTRSTGSRTPLIVGILVVGVLAIVIGSTLFSSGSDDADASGGSSTVGPIPITRAAVQFPASVVDGIVVAGNPAKSGKNSKAAPHTLDLYEDAQCPACQALESRGGARLATAVANGTLKIRYHLLNMLDSRSQPQGYSTLGGNAMMCGAENGIFPDLHVSLYTAQPDEGSAGWTVDQVVDLGKRLGAGPGFEACVRGDAHAKEISANFAEAAHDPKLVRQGQSGFGTPTMVLDGALLQPGDTRLDQLVPATS